MAPGRAEAPNRTGTASEVTNRRSTLAWVFPAKPGKTQASPRTSAFYESRACSVFLAAVAWFRSDGWREYRILGCPRRFLGDDERVDLRTIEGLAWTTRRAPESASWSFVRAALASDIEIHDLTASLAKELGIEVRAG